MRRIRCNFSNRFKQAGRRKAALPEITAGDGFGQQPESPGDYSPLKIPDSFFQHSPVCLSSSDLQENIKQARKDAWKYIGESAGRVADYLEEVLGHLKESEREIKLWFNPSELTEEIYPTKIEKVTEDKLVWA